jgi:hypothetical protein
VIRTPLAPNCNAHAERFVALDQEECFDRVVPLGNATFDGPSPSSSRITNGERNHQGLGNELIDRSAAPRLRQSRSPWLADRGRDFLLRFVPRFDVVVESS